MTEYETLMEMTRIAVAIDTNNRPVTTDEIIQKFNQSCTAYPEINLEDIAQSTVNYVNEMSYEEYMGWLEEITK